MAVVDLAGCWMQVQGSDWDDNLLMSQEGWSHWCEIHTCEILVCELLAMGWHGYGRSAAIETGSEKKDNWAFNKLIKWWIFCRPHFQMQLFLQNFFLYPFKFCWNLFLWSSWHQVLNGSGDGMVPSGNKPLLKTMLTYVGLTHVPHMPHICISESGKHWCG